MDQSFQNSYFYKIAVWALLFLALSGSASLFFYDENAKDAEAKFFASERRKWSQRIAQVGGARAYQEFKTEYKERDFLTRHAVSHILGENLYLNLGPAGIAYCDDSYVFGCFHGFMGRLIGQEGIKSISIADQACPKDRTFSATNCYHGIGHGLLEYFGDQNLMEALDACSLLSSGKMIVGCYGGIFMEYNLNNLNNLMFSKEGSLSFDPEEPYAPCDTVPAKFRQACYYEQSDWWVVKIGPDFVKISQLCQAIDSKQERNACFNGLGRTTAPATHYNKEKIRKICGHMPTHEAQVHCRSGGALRYHEYSFDHAGAKSICAGFEEEEKCLENLEELESFYHEEGFKIEK